MPEIDDGERARVLAKFGGDGVPIGTWFVGTDDKHTVVGHEPGKPA